MKSDSQPNDLASLCKEAKEDLDTIKALYPDAVTDGLEQLIAFCLVFESKGVNTAKRKAE